MRGLAKAAVAALLSTPVLAKQRQCDHLAGLDNSAVFFHYEKEHTYNAPDNTGLTLRLDLLDSDTSCEPSKVALYGQPLPVQSEDGTGNGTLSLADGSSITASWKFTCFPTDDDKSPALWLDFEVEHLDDQSFRADFGVAVTQTSSAVSVDYYTLFSSPWDETPIEVFYKLGPHAGQVVDIDPEVISENTKEEIETYLAEHLIQVEGGDWKPAEVSSSWGDESVDEDEGLGKVGSSSGAATDAKSDSKTAENCRTWKCWMKSVTKKLKSKAGHLYEEIKAHKLSDLYPSSFSKSKAEDDHQVVHNLVGTTTMKPLNEPVSEEAVPTPTPTARFLNSIPPPNQDIMMTLNIAAAAFLIFTILSITILGTRHMTPDVQVLPRHRESREERMARVYERRRSAKRFFARLFCGLFNFDEKADDQGLSSTSPQGNDLRNQRTGGHQTADQEDPDTTMEQELARFREAATMVSSLIAAEEGRNNQVVQQHLYQEQHQNTQRQPPNVPSSTAAAAYPGFTTEEAPPPTYENDAVDGSMVTDGFRYSPGQTNHTIDSSLVTDGLQYTPGNRNYAPGMREMRDHLHNSNSDRLGYGNKD